jgi:hypothetical protein
MLAAGAAHDCHQRPCDPGVTGCATGAQVCLRDCAAEGGAGAELATALLRLDLRGQAPLQARDADVHLQTGGAGGGAGDPWDRASGGARLALRWALVPQARSAAAARTDAWTARTSTAGQQALRLAGDTAWSPVSAGAQAAPSAPPKPPPGGAPDAPAPPDEVAPVAVRDDGVVLESSFEGGAKRELLRALCQVRRRGRGRRRPAAAASPGRARAGPSTAAHGAAAGATGLL